MALYKVEFDEITPWTWYVVEAGNYDLGPFTMLFTNKKSNDEWVAFDYGHDADWVEKSPTIMSREEWDKYKRGKNISYIYKPDNTRWSEMARTAMRQIFFSSTIFYDQNE